jgi:hypothetical protein
MVVFAFQAFPAGSTHFIFSNENKAGIKKAPEGAFYF